MASVKEALGNLGKMSDEELAELKAKDDRSGVQAATDKEVSRRAAGDAPASSADGVAFDLVGEDGRRILRWHSHEACVKLQASIAAASGEKTTIKTSHP
jgi:hypothetical protein